MEKRTLGPAGPEISRFALGTMTFGKETEEKVAREMLDTYVAAGGNFVDTADNYNHGTSERWIAGWLRDRPGARDRVVLATKGRFMVEGQPGAGLTPGYLRKALDASLRRLDVDHVDLYQLHGPDADHPVDEVVDFLGEIVAAGKVRYVGVCNLAGWQVAKLARMLAESGGPPLVSHQVQYSLLARGVEWEIVPAAVDAGVASLVWGPLGQGWLTGKYRRTEQPTIGTRVGEAPADLSESWQRRNTTQTWAIIDRLREVAADHDMTPGQGAFAWVVDRQGIAAPIVGARTVEQLRETLARADRRLDASATAALDEVSTPVTTEYPYPFLEKISHWHS